MGLLDWAWNIISLDHVFFYVGLLIDVDFGAHNVGEICWIIWIFDMSLTDLNCLIWTLYIKLDLNYGVLNLGLVEFILIYPILGLVDCVCIFGY